MDNKHGIDVEYPNSNLSNNVKNSFNFNIGNTRKKELKPVVENALLLLNTDAINRVIEILNEVGGLDIVVTQLKEQLDNFELDKIESTLEKLMESLNNG